MQPDTTIAALVRDQYGMVTRSQALDAGLTERELDRRVASGLLLVEQPGVYRHAAVPRSWPQRVMAAVLVGSPLAVASHRTAARLQDARGIPRWRPEITVPGIWRPEVSGIHVHRTNLLDPGDITEVNGIPCTTRARTFLDLGAVVPYEVVELSVQDAIIRNLVRPEELLAVLERVGKRGRRGTAPLRTVVRHALPDERLESELERRLLALFPPNHGFVLQYELTCVDGRRVRLDTARPDLRLAIEANGRRWHATAADVRRDMERRRSIKASGWDLWEYGWADVVETPTIVTAQVATLIGLAAA